MNITGVTAISIDGVSIAKSLYSQNPFDFPTELSVDFTLDRESSRNLRQLKLHIIALQANEQARLGLIRRNG